MVQGATGPLGWRERARRWAEETLRPLVEEIDRSDRIPASVFPSMAREGFTGLGTAEKWSGAGGGSRETAGVLEELSRVSATVATDLSVHLLVCSAPIRLWGTDAQKERWLPRLARAELLGAFALSEPGVGSDAAQLSTRYDRQPDGFHLRGSKMFITNGASAGVILAFATRAPGSGAGGISAFLVPRATSGLSVAQHLDKLGLRGSETNELVFDDAKVAADALLGEEGRGLSIALASLTGGRIGIAACALGVAQAAYELLEAQVRSEPSDAAMSQLARAHVELSAARALLTDAARAQDEGSAFATMASAAKLLASRAAVSIAGQAVDAIGAPATRHGHAAERLYRDARVFPIVEGTTEIQERILGRALIAPPSSS